MRDESAANYLMEAYKEAKHSKDLSTQNGAVLVNPLTGEIVARGFNDIPKGVADTPERRVRPLKYSCVQHSERAAIFDAARRGVKTDGLHMYAAWVACDACALAIIDAGITRVVGHRHKYQEGQHSWTPSIEIGMQMLKEAGVRVDYYEGMLGFSIRFNGEQVEV